MYRLFVCDMMQTEQAVLLLCRGFDVPSKKKITTQTHSKTHFLFHDRSLLSLSLVFKWFSLAKNEKVHTAETNPAHANNMRLL